MRVLFCVLCVGAVVGMPIAEPADNYEMGMVGTELIVDDEMVPNELINGDFAEDATEGDLQKGPKVNGGYAVNTAPVQTELKVANGDCAGGHYVNGKCLHPFPRNARKATIEDNMESPEQHTEAGYEADIHSFVQKHFGQDVMKETEQANHHVGMPGPEVINFEMNHEGNEDANAAAEDLFPVGTELMSDGNTESPIAWRDINMAQRQQATYANDPNAAAATYVADEVVDMESTISIPEQNVEEEAYLPAPEIEVEEADPMPEGTPVTGPTPCEEPLVTPEEEAAAMSIPPATEYENPV